jgi:arabinan endo-1,5-alpha-L-arabinosidase
LQDALILVSHILQGCPFPPILAGLGFMYIPRSMLHILWLLATFVGLIRAAPPFPFGGEVSQVYETTDTLPLPNLGNIVAHDPNVVQSNGYYYLFKGDPHLPFFKAANMSGPWELVGHVFDKASIIQHKGSRKRPWAPTTIEHNGTFYCYYTLSTHGSRDSAIGVATTTTLDGSAWTDHGAVIETDGGKDSDVYPFNITNAIDASFITDQTTGQSYLNWGSFWRDIWQLPLSADLLSVKNPIDPDAVQLSFIPHESSQPEEGSWMSYHDPYYYVWFSHGKCCRFEKGFPARGEEYSIRVGRSRNVRGPFVDKDNNLLLDGGGTVVYASNNGKVYAPGGVGVLPGINASTSDILYFHYLNTSVGFTDQVCIPKTWDR